MPEQQPEICHHNETRIALLERDRDELKEAVMSLRDSQASISQSLSRLVALEERHIETRDAIGRAFKHIEKIADRLLEIEKAMPGLKEARAWIISGVLAVVGMVGAGLFALVVK